MMQASIWIQALVAGSMLLSAACLDTTGQCSSRTDTLCLQLDIVDHSVIPDGIALTLSTAGMSRPFDFPNIAPTLSKRPYVVEIELALPLPDLLKISASGHLTDPTGPADRVIATAQLTLSPATAARPTLVRLSSGPADLAAPDLPTPHWGLVYLAANRPLNAISGTTSGGLTLYAVGNGGIVVRGNGTTFSASTAGTGTLSGVWPAASTSAWACDREGSIFHTADGMSWQGAAFAGNGFHAIYGRSASDILVVGSNPTTGMHWDGSNWNDAQHNMGVALFGVWASATYYYVSGAGGVGGQANDPEGGGSWTTFKASSNATLRGFTGHLDTDLFPLTVGDGGTVQSYKNGKKWSVVGFPYGSVSLTAAWASGADSAYIGGGNGALYLYRNGVWESVSNANLNGWTLTGLWGDHNGGIWAAASNGIDGAIFKY